MSDMRKRFTKNAEEFDTLMVEMLEENEQLKQEVFELKRTPDRAAIERIMKHESLIVSITPSRTGYITELTLDEIMAILDPNACQCVVDGKALNECSECPR